MMLPPPCFTVGMVFFGWCAILGLHQTSRFAFRPKSSILVSSDHKTFATWFQNLRSGFFAYINRDSRWAFLSNDFLLATLPHRPDLWSALDIVVTCIQWPGFTIKVCTISVTIGFLLTSLISLLAWSSSLERWPDLGRVLVGSYAFHFLMIVLTVLQGIFKAFEIFYTHPLICAFPQLYPGGVLKAPWCSWLSLCCEMHRSGDG